MNNNLSRREKCIVCNGKLSEDLVHIGEQYPSAIFSKSDTEYRSNLKPSSLNLIKCLNDSCGLVQLAYEYNLDYVYENYPYLSSGTATMSAILSDVAREAESLVLIGKNDIVLDIGGNDGTLLSLLSVGVKHLVNIDAAQGITSIVKALNYIYVQKKFSSDIYFNLRLPSPKMIFSIAMFYQLHDPLTFCKQVEDIMSEDTIWCIQMTYLGAMLDSNIYDNIVHEHVAFYSLKSLEYLVSKVGLKICGARLVDSYGGSLRVYVMKKSKKYSSSFLEKEMLAIRDYENKNEINTVNALKRFNERIHLLKDFTRNILDHIIEKNGKILAFGASTKGNMLCQFVGLNSSHVECVLDNNQKKIGLTMVGSDIPIVNEKDYLSALSEYILILPYYYKEYFKLLIEKNLKLNEHKYIIVPLPVPRIIKLSPRS